MTKAAGSTGAGPTVTVAIEQHFPAPQRVLDDSLAYHMLPASMRTVVWMTKPAFMRDWFVRSLEKPAPGIWGGILVRKRFIDEKLLGSAGQVAAIVDLGAGLDTRVYRLAELASVPAWEVDQPENIAAKRAALESALGALPAHVTLVPVDFDREILGDALAHHGYVTGAVTFFILEAVTQYLTEAGIESVFGFLATAAPGSRLAFTYVTKDFIDGTNTHGQDELRAKYVTKEKLWLWGIDPDAVAAFLARYGWQVVEHPTYAELAQKYVTPTRRELVATPIERMVYAEKLGDA
jgi:methyltransferase (TIGR00027 family)